MTPENSALCDRKVAGFLVAAQRELQTLLVPESESLVSVLGHLEAALEYTVEPNEKDSVTYHCRQALRIVDGIERRHDGDLPEAITECLAQLRREVDHALRRIDTTAGYVAVGNAPAAARNGG